MDKPECRNCAHFFQHYILTDGQLRGIYCGHCTHPRMKRKCPDDPACEHFAVGDPDAEMFPRKEYLSQKLLDWIVGLELLPEIEMPWDRE